ncbi:PmoA family protein [Curtobacterium sp. L1-20]|uniref:DUF6807 domain-containing protein n=1 Tax=Curtobacterium sp. L1-20 TaxID=3138181 RepID=UPI003B52110E
MIDAVLHELVIDGALVASVLDGAGTVASSSPRPYLHPVRTLGGTTVSDHHPPDHDWHCGVGVALPDVDGVNCWGGGTYVQGEGYVQRDDHGSAVVRHAAQRGSALAQQIEWLAPDGAVVLHEDRSLAWGPAGTGWEMAWSSSFRAPGDDPVRLGSPGSNGRVGAGYGGFSWRFPGCTEVLVRTAEAAGEQAVHGSVAPWIEWSAVFGGGPATIRLEAIGHRDPWFVRVAEYPAIGSSLAWREVAVVRPGAPFVRSFRAVVRDGAGPEGGGGG